MAIINKITVTEMATNSHNHSHHMDGCLSMRVVDRPGAPAPQQAQCLVHAPECGRAGPSNFFRAATV